MANTTTGSLSDSKQFIVDNARLVREYEGRWKQCCDVVTLSPNSGLTWDEISLAQISAQAVTETTVMENPQSVADALFSIEPTMVGINLLVTDRVYQRMPKSVIAKLGQLSQNAMDRKKDQDYLTTFAGATTTLAGTGQTLSTGIVSSAKSRITSNVTEGAMGTIVGVFHGFQIKDFQDELVSGIGTYTIPSGLTEDVFRRGFQGTVTGVNIYEDAHISINSTPDARGAVHAREALVLVQGHSPRSATKRREEVGGGADEMFMYDEYALGERSAGNWLFGVLSDATAPS